MGEEWIDIEEIVADRKVYGKGVEHYMQVIKSGKEVRPLLVVKHPKRNLYAVLDGHHRYWAQKKMDVKNIKCTVIHDSVGPLFFFTKEGYLQPTSLFTKYIRVPFKKMKNYLEEFLKNPEKLKDALA